MPCVAGNADHADARPLPQILVLQLRHGHVEMRAQPVFQAAQNLAQKDRAGEAPKVLLKVLTESLDRSKKFDPVQRVYNVGATGKLVVTRNARGKVTFSFAKGLAGADGAEVMAVVGQVIKDLT